MSKKRKKITPKKIIKIGLILLIAVAVIFVTKEIIRHQTSPEKTEEEASEKVIEESKAEQKSTEEKKENDSDWSQETEKKEEHQNFEGEDPNERSELTGIITTARVSGENFIVRVSIDQYLSSGTCELKLEKSEKNYEETVNIYSDVSTSTCEGFDIPLSSLEKGVWNATINLSSEGKTGNIEGKVTIE